MIIAKIILQTCILPGCYNGIEFADDDYCVHHSCVAHNIIFGNFVKPPLSHN